MSDAVLSTNVIEGTNYLAGVNQVIPESNWLNVGTFYDYYITLDGRWLSVSSLEPKFLASLIKTLDLPENLLNTPLNNTESQNKFKKILQKKILERTREEWGAVFEGIDACFELVLDLPKAIEHENFKKIRMVVKVPDQDGAYKKQIASPFKFSDCKTIYKHFGLGIGE